MTAVCTPYHAIGMTVTDSATGPRVQEPAREVADRRLVATGRGSDGSVLTPTQDKEVIRNG
jgi:hypothetical protein